ncbi:type II toxin-antitoxin system VapB family antitoxin [Escherichia coli]
MVQKTVLAWDIFRFPSGPLIAVGRTRIITPAGESWDSWFDGDSVSADFMNDREQPAVQERESF